MPVIHFISRFESTSYEKFQDTATSSFVSCCFTSAFTLPDITFYNFLELHVALSEKRLLSQVFLFLTDSPKTLNSQNALSVTKFFFVIISQRFCDVLLPYFTSA